MNNKTPKNIGLFKLYTKKPNTISKGSLYIAEIAINTQNEDKIRKIRVIRSRKESPVAVVTTGGNDNLIP